LKDVIEEIKNDDPKTTPPNGNIHPITIETITFIENLLPFDVIAGMMANVVGERNPKFDQNSTFSVIFIIHF
jgi:hypothetical protein